MFYYLKKNLRIYLHWSNNFYLFQKKVKAFQVGS